MNQAAVETPKTMKKLDSSIGVYKKSMTLQSHDDALSEQMQSEMDYVNKKIDKAKQSISKLQTEGGIKGI